MEVIQFFRKISSLLQCTNSIHQNKISQQIYLNVTELRLYLQVISINKIIQSKEVRMTELINVTGPKSFGTSPKKSCFQLGDKTIPGPGKYNPFKHNNSPNPQWRIGKSTMRNTFLDPHLKGHPSPQSYKVNHSSIEKQPHKFSIPKSTNSHSKITQTPFFSKQSSTLNLNEAKSFSFGYNFEIGYENDRPGPGAYDPKNRNNSLNRTQNHFGLGDRPPPYGQQGKFPGPTKYQNKEDKISPQFSFPKEQRFNKIIKDQSPGVFYEIDLKKKQTIKNRIFDIKQSKRETVIFQHNQNPAPNHYNIQIQHKISSGVIEASKRTELANTAIFDTPSPEKYAGQQILALNNKGCSFVKDIRHLSVTQRIGPAPGAYQPMKTFSTIGGSIGKQKQKEVHFVTPSACYYKPKQNLTRFRGQSTIVLKEDRVDFSKTITGQIGPGSYDLASQHHKSQLGKMGIQKKKISLSQITPGVGNYNIPNTIGKLPNYFSSPKKITQNGYSTFHQKLKFKMLQRQKLKMLENQEENAGIPHLLESKESESKNIDIKEEDH